MKTSATNTQQRTRCSLKSLETERVGLADERRSVSQNLFFEFESGKADALDTRGLFRLFEV